ncbi:hypothetical protein AHF37_03098 [Paragonimus kellicotti]|nr:hypothetical protein AHF37_03098 [Paragonimus kellicotti]
MPASLTDAVDVTIACCASTHLSPLHILSLTITQQCCFRSPQQKRLSVVLISTRQIFVSVVATPPFVVDSAKTTLASAVECISTQHQVPGSTAVDHSAPKLTNKKSYAAASACTKSPGNPRSIRTTTLKQSNKAALEDCNYPGSPRKYRRLSTALR